MPSSARKRDISSFFKPHARTPPASTIPQKRPSPCTDVEEKGEDDDDDDDDEDTIVVHPSLAQKNNLALKTPSKPASFKNVTPRSARTVPLVNSPRSGASLPIRSPQPVRISVEPPSRKSRARSRNITRSPSPSKFATSTTTLKDTSFTFSDISELSNRSIVEDGKVVAVRDSDDDTDSLESLEDLIGRRATGPSSSISPPEKDEVLLRERPLDLHHHQTSSRAWHTASKAKLKALDAKEQAVKFDLTSILDEHLGDIRAEERVRKAREEASEDDANSGQDGTDLLARIARTAGDDVDDDNVGRLLHAVERTEALAGEKSYSFFDLDSDVQRGDNELSLPAAAIPDGLWRAGDIEAQSRFYLSGMVAELASKGRLGEEALKSTFRSTITEPNDSLRQSYIKTLCATNEALLRLTITQYEVTKVFERLGASKDVSKSGHKIEPRYQRLQKQASPNKQQIVTALTTFNSICQNLEIEALSQLSSLVIRLSMDNQIMSDGQIAHCTETLLESLLNLHNSISRKFVLEHILQDASDNVHDNTLQARLLHHIIPTTPAACLARKSLADIFLFGPSIIDKETFVSRATIDDVTQLLRSSPIFRLTRHAGTDPVDYVSLAALTALLDISIGSGNPPPPLSSLSASSTTAAQSTSRSQSLSRESSTYLRPPSTSPRRIRPTKPPPTRPTTVTEFNNSIDTLADTIHDLSVGIKDTGASHMRRTEAKDALNALYFRLLYSVRVGVRKKKHVFDMLKTTKDGKDEKLKRVGRNGEVVEEERKSGDFMKRFLAR